MANPPADFPAALHTATDTTVFTATALGTTSPSHTAVHGKIEQEMLATQQKLGAGSGAVPANGQFLYGTAPGSTAWSTANTLPIRGSGLAILASGTGNVIAFLDNNGNFFISGQYLSL